MKSLATAAPTEPIFVVYNIDHEPDPEVDEPALRSDSSVVDVAIAVGEALGVLGRPFEFVELSDSTAPLAGLASRWRRAVFFNLVESLGRQLAREMEVPALLTRIGAAYTGNNATALRVALDKGLVRRILDEHGVPIARGGVVRNGAEAAAIAARRRLRFPLFVKPARLDASIAITQRSVVRDIAELREQVDASHELCGGPVVVEEYLPGPETNVAVCPTRDGRLHVASCIDFSTFGPHLSPIVTYDCKWSPDSEEFSARSVPAAELIHPRSIAESVDTACSALAAIGATGYARVDLRIDAVGRSRVIDINPNPDIHPESGFALSLYARGLGYPTIIDEIVRAAWTRRQDGHPIVRIRGSRPARAFA